jgi:hypothetical protein
LQKCVYGLGVVFYLDGPGKIHGVMTWGLPTTTTTVNRDDNSSGTGHGTKRLNQQLVQLMKEIIVTNGGFRAVSSEQDAIRMSRYLETKAKEILCLALSSSSSSSLYAETVDNDDDDAHQLILLGRAVDHLPRPLHRCTEIRPPSLRSLGFHKAKDGRAHGVVGENLFSRAENDNVPDLPIPKPDLAVNVGAAAAKVQALYDWNVWEQTERRWQENETRARPPKEDPCWIRKGDETRNISHQDRLASAYRSILGGASGGGGW